jgi:anti-anti-sigma regulatory factor
VHATSQVDGQALIDRVRRPRGPARLTRERATDARGCFVRSASLHSVDDAGRAGARAGRIARGDGVVLVELVEVVGVVDIAARQELTDVLWRAMDSGAPVVIVDLSGVTLLAAAGFNCLRQAADLPGARNGCRHLVCSAGSPAARVLRLFDPGGSWPVHAAVPIAVAAAAGRA